MSRREHPHLTPFVIRLATGADNVGAAWIQPAAARAAAATVSRALRSTPGAARCARSEANVEGGTSTRLPRG